MRPYHSTADRHTARTSLQHFGALLAMMQLTTMAPFQLRLPSAPQATPLIVVAPVLDEQPVR
jgi:hypothetical protein